MHFSLPYYRGTLDIDIPEENLLCVIEAETDKYIAPKSEIELVRDSLMHPIGTDRLSSLAKDKRTALIVTSDHTRAMPSRVTLPILLEELRAENPEIDVTILIATGLHRPTTRDEMINMFGEDIVNEEKIAIHDCRLENDMRFVCTLPSGAEFSVNKLALETDLLICEGFIEPHFFAGFSGGRKSILPGISSKTSVNFNHSAMAIGSAWAKAGSLEKNPLHIDMNYAVQQIGVDFILNVALNGEKKIIGSFAGDVFAAYDEGVSFVKSLCMKPKVDADIVITTNGGYPLDQNLYQAPKSVASAKECAGENGIVILGCSLCDGTGGADYERIMLSGTPSEIQAMLQKIPPKETIQEQWCAQIFSRIMEKHHVIIVTQHYDHEMLKKMHFGAASTFNEALELAFALKGKDAKIALIPDGVAVIFDE